MDGAIYGFAVGIGFAIVENAFYLSRAGDAARADGTYDRKLTRFTNPRLLIVDDLGLCPLVHDEPMDLYELIRQRYERGSLILTSNRDVSEWYPLFGDALLATAAMDRLLHHCHIVVLDGQSFRTGKKAA